MVKTVFEQVCKFYQVGKRLSVLNQNLLLMKCYAVKTEVLFYEKIKLKLKYLLSLNSVFIYSFLFYIKPSGHFLEG